MKVYLASWFSSKELIKQRALELEKAGVFVTSRWLDENVAPTTTVKDVTDEYLRETAILDLEDILKADTFVLFTPSDADLETVPKRSWARGGRNFEMGFAYAVAMFWTRIAGWYRTGGRRLLICGPRDGVFHWLYKLNERGIAGFVLPEIEQFDTWEQTRDALIERAFSEHIREVGNRDSTARPRC